jgi:hypothetical protein
VTHYLNTGSLGSFESKLVLNFSSYPLGEWVPDAGLVK